MDNTHSPWHGDNPLGFSSASLHLELTSASEFLSCTSKFYLLKSDSTFQCIHILSVPETANLKVGGAASSMTSYGVLVHNLVLLIAYSVHVLLLGILQPLWRSDNV